MAEAIVAREAGWLRRLPHLGELEDIAICLYAEAVCGEIGEPARERLLAQTDPDAWTKCPFVGCESAVLGLGCDQEAIKETLHELFPEEDPGEIHAVARREALRRQRCLRRGSFALPARPRVSRAWWHGRVQGGRRGRLRRRILLVERIASPRRAPSRPSRAPRRSHVARVATVSSSPGGGGPGDGDPDQPDPPASPWPSRQGLVPPSPRSSSSDLIPSGPEPVGLLAHGLLGGGRW